MYSFSWAADKYPVSPGHTLPILKRPAVRSDELTQEREPNSSIGFDWIIEHLQQALHPDLTGFNTRTNERSRSRPNGSPSFHGMLSRATQATSKTRVAASPRIPSKANYWQAGAMSDEDLYQV